MLESKYMFASRLSQFTIRRRLKAASAAVTLVFLLTGTIWSQAAPPSPPSPPAPQASPSPQSPSQPSSPPPAPAPNQPQAPAQPQAPSQPATPAQPPTPTRPQSPQQPNSPAAAQVPGEGVGAQNQQPGNGGSQQPQAGANQSSEPPEPESRITKQQAKELFRSVDEILDFVSEDTGLPIEHKVKRNLITREEVEKYVDKRMKDDKDEKRLEQSRLVLQKFGLLPPNYDLHAEFVRLMAEQVAAYYDPKTKSVNLLDWVQPEAQKPILAHELTHALQDQKVGVEKWELAGAKDDSTPLPDQQEYVVEEEQSARQAVTEGQGMAVMFDYMLAPMGKNLLTAPEIVTAMRAGMGDNSKDSPEFSQAPMFLKESMLMPYTFGLDFVRAVLANKGKEMAYAGILENPPIDTRQIMQPETYLLGQKVAPLTIPDLDKMVAPNYERFDFGGMGEFDIYLLAKQYGAEDTPNYYRHWRGGYYFAAHRKNAPKDQIAMLFFTRWDSPEAAYDFARLYAEYLPKRYQEKVQWTKTCPVIADGAARDLDCTTMTGTTSEGPILIERHDNDLLIMEGYDQTAMQKARDVLFYNMSLPEQSEKGKH
jgi:hypothetical protein